MLNRFVQIIFITFYGCQLIGCSLNNQSDSGYTIIKGKIQNPPGSIIYFCTYADSFSLFLGKKAPVDSCMIDKHGNYSFKLKNSIPEAFNLESGGKFLVPNLFLIPGFNILINFKGSRNDPEIKSDDIGSRYNRFLIQFMDTFYHDTVVNREYYIATNYMDIHQFTTYNEKRKQKQVEFFNDYFDNDSINPDFKNYALNTINYGIAVDRLMYLWKKRMKSENIFGDSSYFSFETQDFIQNNEAFNCPAYIRFLNLYIKDIYERKVENGELPLVKSENLIPVVEKYKLTVELLDKPYRNVVLYNIIAGDLNDVSIMNHAESEPDKSLDSMIARFCRKYSL